MSNNNYIDIKVVMDPECFSDNHLQLNTPFSNLPEKNDSVWMIAEHDAVLSGQATAYRLVIKAKPGDYIRWWDTPLTQDKNEKDMIIVGFDVAGSDKWGDVFEETESLYKTVGMPQINSGFSLDSLENIKFGMSAAPHNYIQAKVKSNAKFGDEIRYYLIVAKLDVSHVGEQRLIGLYRIDPVIKIQE